MTLSNISKCLCISSKALSEAVLAGKIRRAMAPERKVEERGSGGFAPKKIFSQTPFALRKCPF